ncbi:ferritin family protein [Magnetovirga frankeli]|uniref:ferritin family protein n=1 Tax=Magnetovirga frankeli TaxID=947516 RepID=UPI001292D432|nr:ferritin family protein [gamma proteobacterium SS-5]
MPEGKGYQRLKAQTTVEEVLNVAIDFERTARDFYSGMIPKVSKNIRYLVEELAAEEQEHFRLFTELLERDDMMQVLETEIERPVNDHKFSDCIHLPEMGENPDDQSILQYAMMREHAAMEQYGTLAESTPEGPIKTLFQFLANEETKHKVELEKLYYQIIHSGGV